MPKLSDKELDRLFRKAANEYDPQMPGGNWDKMKERLDKELPVKRIFHSRTIRKILIYSIGSAVLLTGIFYYFIDHFNPRASKKQNVSLPIASKSATSAGLPQTVLKFDTPFAKSDNSLKPNTLYRSSYTFKNKPDRKDYQRKQPFVRDSTVSIDDALSGNHHGSRVEQSYLTSDRHNRLLLPDITSLHQKAKNDKDYMELPARQDKPRDLPGSANRMLSSQPSTPSARGSLGLRISRNSEPWRTTPIVSDSSLRSLGRNSGNLHKNSAPDKKRSLFSRTNNVVQIGLSIGPDLTSVKSYAQRKPGTLFGMTMNYAIGRQWSVNTGFLWIHKNYEARGKDFNLPAGSWLNSLPTVRLNYVEGNMDLFEIPLNLRYNVHLTHRTSLFASVGLSSYLVENENCVYYFQTLSYQRKETGCTDVAPAAGYPQGYKSKPFLPFAASNMSVGLETAINQRISIQWEPYCKLPLKGAGHGDIRMISYGLNFSVKYSVLSK